MKNLKQDESWTLEIASQYDLPSKDKLTTKAEIQNHIDTNTE